VTEYVEQAYLSFVLVSFILSEIVDRVEGIGDRPSTRLSASLRMTGLCEKLSQPCYRVSLRAS